MTAALQEAIRLHERGELERAMALYGEVLRAEPAHAEALYRMGLAALHRGDGVAGRDWLTRALRVNPGNPAVLAALGDGYLAGGNLPAALAQYDAALKGEPARPEVLYNRGSILLILGRHAEALASFDRAIESSPSLAAAHNNRGVALRGLGRHEAAVKSFSRALALEPSLRDALGNRADALAACGRPEEALGDYDRLLRAQPDNPELWNQRGNLLLALRRPAPALESFERLLALRPDDFRAHNGRGLALRHLGRREEALACFAAALERQPGSPEVLTNRATALLLLSRPEEALATFDHALRLRPGFAPALRNRGAALLELNRPAEALENFDAFLRITPGNAEVLSNRGDALRALKLSQEAAASYGQALRLNPVLPEALMNLGVLFTELQQHAKAKDCLERLIAVAPDFEFALGNLLFSKLTCCEWSGYADLRARASLRVAADQRVAFAFAAVAIFDTPTEQLRCARTYIAARYPPVARPLYAGERYAHDRIRIAYLSADFREHAVAHLAAGLFERHDRSRFQTIALSLQPQRTASPMRARLESAFEQFHDVSSSSDREAATLLRELEVDIAVDLTAHTYGGRQGILAFRPAPVQVNWLGFPGTFGASYVDYLLADPVVVPAGDEDGYLEKIVRLPHCYLPTGGWSRREPSLTRAGAGLPECGFIFCAFNTPYKISPTLFALWMRLLERVPESVLWLRDFEPLVTENLRRSARAHGVAPERLWFAPFTGDLSQHLERYSVVDLFLDTLPYGAHSTACDALWAGVPVLTCRGRTFAGRVAASLLTAIGLPELIAESLEEYERLALHLANDPQALRELRARLARNRAAYPLFDTDRFRAHLESAFHTMWERHQRREPPAAFDVPPLGPAIEAR